MENPQKLILKNFQSPGDVLVMTGAIECLRIMYPGKYLIDVDTSCNAIYEGNPGITKLDRKDPDVRVIDMQYPLIHKCNQRPVHFIQGYCDYLSEQLGVPIPPLVNRPQIWLSEKEKKWLPQVHEFTGRPVRYWVINAGIKNDFTNKNWGYHNYQKVVDQTQGLIQWVQIGAREHVHKPLVGVIDMLGKTDARQLIRMCWHAQGGLGPITFVQHIFAAFQKPYVALLGGREPMQWEGYHTQTTMSTLGQLPCCQYEACWKSRTVPLGDNDDKDKSLCALPMFTQSGAIPKCMAMISPDDVVRAVSRYYTGGVIRQ